MTMIGLGLLLLVLVGGVLGLYMVAENMEPPSEPMEDVLDDDMFPK